MSHANSRGALGDGNMSGKRVNRKGSRQSFVHELVSLVAKIDVDPNQGDRNEGKYWVQDNHGASRKFFIVFAFPYSSLGVDKGLVPNLRGEYNPGGTSRNPSRASLCNILP